MQPDESFPASKTGLAVVFFILVLPSFFVLWTLLNVVYPGLLVPNSVINPTPDADDAPQPEERSEEARCKIPGCYRHAGVRTSGTQRGRGMSTGRGYCSVHTEHNLSYFWYCWANLVEFANPRFTWLGGIAIWCGGFLLSMIAIVGCLSGALSSKKHESRFLFQERWDRPARGNPRVHRTIRCKSCGAIQEYENVPAMLYCPNCGAVESWAFIRAIVTTGVLFLAMGLAGLQHSGKGFFALLSLFIAGILLFVFLQAIWRVAKPRKKVSVGAP